MTDMPEATTSDDPQPTIERLRRGAHSIDIALTGAYDAHRAELFAFLLRMTRDRDAAEDVLHDTFIRLINEARAGRMPDAVRPWLYRVAANAAISRGRRASALTRLLPHLLDRWESARAETDLLGFERDAELHAAMLGLEPDGRAAMLLAAQGFNGSEIAAAIGRSEGATRTLLCRSRMRLRLVLEAQEGRP
jgi:RNA polymerase sigma-70 factor (ECF subfamily)